MGTSVFNNLSVMEIVPIAGAGVAVYRSLSEHNDVTTAMLVGLPALYLLNSAASNDQVLGETPHTGFAFGNFGLIELACLGALGWGAYRLAVDHEDYLGAMGAGLAILLALTESSQSKGEF